MDKFEWPPHSDEFVSIRVAIFSELLLRYEFIRHNFNQGHKKSTSRLDCRFQLRYQKAFSPIIKFDYLSRVSRVKWSHRLNKRVRPHPTEDLNLQTKTFVCYIKSSHRLTLAMIALMSSAFQIITHIGCLVFDVHPVQSGWPQHKA